MTKTSDRPWVLDSDKTYILDADGIRIGAFVKTVDALLVLRAVNNFDEMKAALEQAQQTLEMLVNVVSIKDSTDYAQVIVAGSKARAVLAKIGEGET